MAQKDLSSQQKVDPQLKAMGERLKLIREKLELSGEEFGKRLGGKGKAIDKSTISKYEKGIAPISAKAKVELYTTVGVNPLYLESGIEPVFKAPVTDKDEEDKDDKSVIKKANPAFRNEAILRGDHSSDQYYMNSAGKIFTQIGEDSYLIHTPHVQPKARAGYMMGWGDETYINQLPTHPIVVDRPYKGYYVSFTVAGDSMDDGSKEAVSDGDIVTGRRIDKSLWTSQLHINDYPDFVIHTRDGLLVKRIIAHNVKEGYITIHSLNPDKEAYPDQDINLQDVAELFNIIKVTADRKRK